LLRTHSCVHPLNSHSTVQASLVHVCGQFSLQSSVQADSLAHVCGQDPVEQAKLHSKLSHRWSHDENPSHVAPQKLPSQVCPHPPVAQASVQSLVSVQLCGQLPFSQSSVHASLL
jgi:hypothetical protein